MKIATFNCNSIRQRVDIVIDWIAKHEPDVLALQELKCENEKFPAEAFEEIGYQVAVHGQKAWNGVATLSLWPMEDIRMGFGDPLFPEDCRVLACSVNGLRLVNTYVPNGTKVGTDKFDYKLRWFDRLQRFLTDYGADIWMGDINVAPKPEDVYDPKKFFGGVGHHPAEFARLEAILALGWQDLFRKFTKDGAHYTYWDYYIIPALERNNGWRIDHIYGRGDVVDRCTACEIDVGPRHSVKPSDHTFVWAEVV